MANETVPPVTITVPAYLQIAILKRAVQEVADEDLAGIAGQLEAAVRKRGKAVLVFQEPPAGETTL